MDSSRAILMDIDDTLLDSSEVQAQVWLQVLNEFGYAVDYQQVRARIGLGPDRMLRDLCGVSEASPRAQRLLPIRELLLREKYLYTARGLPGAPELLRRLQAANVKLAVVTAAPRSEAFALLGAARLLAEFDHVICREDVSRTKPAPDGILLALQRMGVQPSNATFLASSAYDVEAAEAAGVRCLELRGHDWPHTLLEAHASKRPRPSNPYAA